MEADRVGAEWYVIERANSYEKRKARFQVLSFLHCYIQYCMVYL
jgi:hypothetical protein